MLEFYQTMLNIKKWDTKEVITILDKVIKKEMDEVLKYTNDLEGLCKVLSTNIKVELDKIGFKTHKIDISDIYKELKNHEFLILNYQDTNNKFNYVLIDPTYIQFCKTKEKSSPLYFEAWPSEILQNINPNLLKNLLTYKYSYVDDKNINDYLASFTNKVTNVNLESIILNDYKGNNRVRYF